MKRYYIYTDIGRLEFNTRQELAYQLLYWAKEEGKHAKYCFHMKENFAEKGNFQYSNEWADGWRESRHIVTRFRRVAHKILKY